MVNIMKAGETKARSTTNAKRDDEGQADDECQGADELLYSKYNLIKRV